MNNLECILFSEFDHILGPKISHQVPRGYISDDVYDVIHEYIITKPNLCGRLMTVSVFNVEIMGFPILLEGSKYPRNYLLFNLCFVFKEPTPIYEQVLRKLAILLRSTEKESEFISNPNSRPRFYEIIDQIFHTLKTQGECSIPVNDANTIYLKLFQQLPAPCVVMDHEVPVLIRDVDISTTKEWDLAIQQILPFIDGVNHVKRISHISKVNIEIVEKCIQHLLYFDYIAMVDVFQFSNIYTCTPHIIQLAESVTIQAECIQFVSKPDCGTILPFEKIFFLYCSLRPGVCLRDFCQEHDVAFQKIDARRFITFGILNGYIRRIHKYLFVLSPKRQATKGGSSVFKNIDLDGKKSADQLCCTLSLGSEKLEAAIKTDKEIITMCK